jgi:hypothetical protein
LAKAHFENTMKLSDPPFLPLGQGLIIDMGVTDENIIHEAFLGCSVYKAWSFSLQCFKAK